MSKSFVDLLIVNTIIPIQFAYAKSIGKEISEDLIQLIMDVGAEKNAVIDKFVLLELKPLMLLKASHYCNLKMNIVQKASVWIAQ